MKLKLKNFGGLFLLFLLFSIFFVPIFALSSTVSSPTIRTIIAPHLKELNVTGPEIHSYFYKIASTKYNIKTNNCKIKSEEFASYLVQHGATNVYLVDIQDNRSLQFHECVQWQGKIYDPTLPAYAMDQNEYYGIIKNYGLNGLKFISPYP